MSNIKRTIKHIQKHYKTVIDDANYHIEKLGTADKQLSTKIKKIANLSQETIEYIIKRSEEK